MFWSHCTWWRKLFCNNTITHIQTFILRTLNQYDAQIADVIPRTKELKNTQLQTSDQMGCLQIRTMMRPNILWYLLRAIDSSNPFIFITQENGMLYNTCNIRLQLNKWLFCASSFKNIIFSPNFVYSHRLFIMMLVMLHFNLQNHLEQM